MEGFSKSQVDKAGRLLASDSTKTVGEVEDAVDVVDWWRAQHQRPLLAVNVILYRCASDEGEPVIGQRLKRVPTIADKLRREPTMRLSRMADVGGVRAVLPDQGAAYRVARLLRANWTITRFRDYVSEPKPDGYRALHLISRNGGRLTEIQLRTSRQDEWANRVDTLARIFPGLKAGAGPIELREGLVASSELYAAEDELIEPLSRARLSEIQAALERAGTFLAELRDDP